MYLTWFHKLIQKIMYVSINYMDNMVLLTLYPQIIISSYLIEHIKICFNL